MVCKMDGDSTERKDLLNSRKWESLRNEKSWELTFVVSVLEFHKRPIYINTAEWKIYIVTNNTSIQKVNCREVYFYKIYSVWTEVPFQVMWLLKDLLISNKR